MDIDKNSTQQRKRKRKRKRKMERKRKRKRERTREIKRERAIYGEREGRGSVDGSNVDGTGVIVIMLSILPRVLPRGRALIPHQSRGHRHSWVGVINTGARGWLVRGPVQHLCLGLCHCPVEGPWGLAGVKGGVSQRGEGVYAV